MQKPRPDEREKPTAAADMIRSQEIPHEDTGMIEEPPC